MNSALNTALVVAVVALITAFTRALPFLLFGGSRDLPAVVRYLGAVLPASIMVILVAYCLRGIRFAAYPHGLPEIVASLLVAGLQIWKKNALVSIAAGTACYMLLLRIMACA